MAMRNHIHLGKMDYGSTCWHNAICTRVLRCKLTYKPTALLNDQATAAFGVLLVSNIFDIYLCVGRCHEVDVAMCQIWSVNAANH